MTTAVVIQPSYIPWRGYFDLIRQSDVFVFYDDVQYDKHGWRNRNRIKTPEGLRWLTIPVHAKGNVSDATPINQIEIDWRRDWRKTHQEQIRHAYAKAPYYKNYRELLDDIYSAAPQNLADFTVRATIRIAAELGIGHVRYVKSSELGASGTKNDRLLDVLGKIGATRYISGPSAKAYIDAQRFAESGIALEYIEYAYEPYPQLHSTYEAGVSILDLLFMTGPAAARHLSGAKTAGSM